MIKEITPSKSHISTQKNLQPRPQTLHTILADGTQCGIDIPCIRITYGQTPLEWPIR